MEWKRYEILSEALADLYERGFLEEFEFGAEGLVCKGTGKKYPPDEVRIVENHHFGIGGAGGYRHSVLFALLCQDGCRGLITTHFEPLPDMLLVQFMDRVKVARVA